jgi:hypothetical protein
VAGVRTIFMVRRDDFYVMVVRSEFQIYGISASSNSKEFGRCNSMSSTFVCSNSLSHVFTRNLGSTQQTTYTKSCLISHLVDQR